MKKRTLSLATPLAIAIAASSFVSTQTFATEGGGTTTPMGASDFGAGFLPPKAPNGLLGLRYAYYEADTLHGNEGNPFPGQDFSLGVNAISALYLKMTDYELFGVKYGYCADYEC
ncbi:transporter family protein [Marinomonas mediterranea]|jgi:Protein involved in meta-pathway of phenol degradation|uniref:hypothetical protein n=1 Tax=Marinomonas mediterranea TaxID=119864 RepID=UPI000306C31D|nr:hypothetical protein [Marinomonas mediterranea]WCN16620.1 hypothetical protein GV053_05895 [Marinomonas mediterranea MMB-1]